MDLLERLKEKYAGMNWKLLLIYLAVCLLMMCVLTGKSRRAIQSMAVSADEGFVGFFETGEGFKLRCYGADGTQSFSYEIPAELSAGGYCTVWFEENVLCAYFYRTEKVAQFSLDGNLLEVAEYTQQQKPDPFPGFYKKNARYIYRGENLEFTYHKQNGIAYWLFGAVRSVTVTTKTGETTTLLSWTAS